MKQLLILFMFLFINPVEVYSAEAFNSKQQQGDHHHSEEEVQDHPHREGFSEEAEGENAEVQREEPEITYEGLFAPFDKFPNLHPLVVHFPVVLIPMALLFQVIALFWYRKAMGLGVLLLLGVGTAGGLLAAFWLHPHVGELPLRAREVFENHEYFAYRSLILAGTALLLKLVTFFFLNRNRIAEIIILLLLTGATYTISMAGHLGSQLVFIEEVGPKGKNLEDHPAGEHSH